MTSVCPHTNQGWRESNSGQIEEKFCLACGAAIVWTEENIQQINEIVREYAPLFEEPQMTNPAPSSCDENLTATGKEG